jgi:hypothetical protein
MTNLRKLAKGRGCQVRLAVCNANSETVVLGHVRLSGISGMGLKAPDALGAWICSACHQFADTHHDDATQRAFLEGVMRTQAQLLKEGALRT